ncbi:hypothetical protein FRZ03_15420 [Streptomyces misionensis]|uniref:DUF305 domain-containing protein n=1 Tax=Streptomyces misionensis TaxID=67331 RepID=A0A5C6JT73_9ACTN|nr:hypothetical protein [Streptomyces misionensis]TWV46002.1 hypothetical protein FRZ03_15420 [Streptomyces misionensis]
MNAPSPSDTSARGAHARAADSKLLGIYLNDHLAGATAGVLRAGHLARASSGTALGRDVGPVAREIAQDRAALLGIMRDLGVPVRRYKVCAGWAGERLGRLKSNGRLIRRSPLSTVLELEALRMAVEGKAAGWQTLRRLGAVDRRLDAAQLDTLLERARRQQRTLEDWRIREAEAVFGATRKQASGE